MVRKPDVKALVRRGKALVGRGRFLADSSFEFNVRPPTAMQRLVDCGDAMVRLRIELPAPAIACAVGLAVAPSRFGKVLLGASTVHINGRAVGLAVFAGAAADAYRKVRKLFK
jgi:hypothetical protein